MSYLGEGAVVPQVALVGEAVADVAKLALLDVLLDGVQELLLGDLQHEMSVNACQLGQKALASNPNGGRS